MIYRLLLLSDENDFFQREITIDAEASFLQLNDFILDSLNYSRKELTTFYVSDEEWQKGQEVTLMDMSFGKSEEDSFLMESTRLEELIENRGDRLIFIFDLISERGLYIELVELLAGSQAEPKLTHSEGKAPQQTSSFEFAETRSVGGAGLGFEDDDIFDEDGFDSDDLDAEGFSELDSLEGY